MKRRRCLESRAQVFRSSAGEGSRRPAPKTSLSAVDLAMRKMGAPGQTVERALLSRRPNLLGANQGTLDP
eukprot:11855340-Alexandrium_andersonii.AAC.1